jgi:2-polyprenyl-3-methyl-5-hydroxy-6-metoxy-1,4-benzoquinol methylase
MSIRDLIQESINKFQFVFDVFPNNGNYQPLPWLGLNKGKRGEGTIARWQAIEASLSDHTILSAMDIGSNLGYFCFSLSQKGIPVMGVDMDSRFLRIAQYASRKLKASRVGLCNLVINTETVRLLPQVDLILLLSVWHHWVREYGLETASQILAAVWQKTNKVLFFETGELEMPSEFGLSVMGDSPKEWLMNYLGTLCANSEIVHLGQFKAFAPLGNEERHVVLRNMFKVTRRGEMLP